MNLVQSLGRPYFADYFRNAMFVKDDEVLRVETAERSGVTCSRLRDQSYVTVPFDFFQGFKTFAYPELGYRRIKDNVIGYMNRKQSVHRGLRSNHISTVLSPCTTLLVDLGQVNGLINENEKGLAVWNKTFDTLADLPRLLAGELTGLVLSPALLIEPSVETANDWYSVYYMRSLIGKVNSRGTFTWSNPNHSTLIEGL